MSRYGKDRSCFDRLTDESSKHRIRLHKLAMIIRLSPTVTSAVRNIESRTGKSILDRTDKVGCMDFEELSAFVACFGNNEEQEAFASSITLDLLILRVEHREMMKVAEEKPETKKMREYLRLKKEKREVRQLTGRSHDTEISNDKALGSYEKSVKFAMTFIFALFSSGIGGYFAAKVFLGMDHSYVFSYQVGNDHSSDRHVRFDSRRDRTLHH